MPKNKLVKALIIVVLVLLVPFLIGRTTVAILNITYPPAAPATARSLRAEGQAAIRSLERARAITRIALVVIGVYYVVLLASWIILRRQQRKLLRS